MLHDMRDADAIIGNIIPFVVRPATAKPAAKNEPSMFAAPTPRKTASTVNDEPVTPALAVEVAEDDHTPLWEPEPSGRMLSDTELAELERRIILRRPQ